MSEKNEQVKHLAPAFHRLDIEQTDAFPVVFMTRRHRRCIKWGGCFLSILSIILTVFLVLMFTVFHVKDPSININYVSIQGLSNRTADIDLDRGFNITIEADVSIKNPNVASFKFSNMSMSVHYDGSIVGEMSGSSGEVRARKTLRVSLSIELRADEMLEVGRLESDLSSGIMPISSYTGISGDVKISDEIKRSFFVRTYCTMNVNVSSQRIQDQKSRKRV